VLLQYGINFETLFFFLVQEGRKGRNETFSSQRHKLNPNSSTTNKQKAKNKAFAMINKKSKGFRKK
jgi:hypothetical protein